MTEVTDTQQASSVTPAGDDGALARRIPGTSSELATLRGALWLFGQVGQVVGR